MTSAGGQAPGAQLAAVLKLADLAAQAGRVEQPARQRFGELTAACGKALAQVTAARQEAGTLGDRADGIERTLAELGALLSRISSRLAGLTERTGVGGAAGGGDPVAAYAVSQAPPWWAPGHERAIAAMTRLRDWVDEVCRPGFGYLGSMLGECWDQHPLCVACLDTLHEAWCLLYIPPRDPKMVFAQLDWLTRPLLQAAASSQAPGPA